MLFCSSRSDRKFCGSRNSTVRFVRLLMMAEPLGLAMSGVALAGLFSTCIEFIEYFEQGKNFAKDFQLALTKVSLMKRRLSQWGATMSIKSPGAEAKKFQDRWPAESGVIMESLMGIRDILASTTHMCRRYRCSSKEQQDPAKWLEWRIDGGACCGRTTLGAASPFSTKAYRHDSLKTVRLKALWAIQDKKKFQALIADFDFLLGNLEKIGERLQKEKTMANRNVYSSGEHESQPALPELNGVEKDSDSDLIDYSTTEFITSGTSTAPSSVSSSIGKRESPPYFHPTSKMSSTSTNPNRQNTTDFWTLSTGSKAKEIHISSRKEGEHFYSENETEDNATVHEGDYYEGGIVPSSAKGHIFVNQRAGGDSSVWAGNTDGKTAIQMERERQRARERRDAAAREAQAQKGSRS